MWSIKLIFKKNTYLLVFFIVLSFFSCFAFAKKSLSFNASKKSSLLLLARRAEMTDRESLAIWKTTHHRHKIINHIKIETTNPSLQIFIEGQLEQYKNKNFSKKISEEIYDKILSILKLKRVLLPDISEPVWKTTKEGVYIIYKIKNPYKYGFILKGNKVLDRYQLLSTKDYEKHFNNTRMIRKIISRIKNAYLKKGYMNVQVSHKTIIDDKNFIKTVILSVEEGKQPKISALRVFGQFSKPDKYYVKKILNYSGPLIQKRLFYNLDLQRGVDNLINLLKNEGWFKARAHTRITNTPENRVLIDIILNEGPLVKVKSIQFKGNKYFSDTQLKDLMKLKTDKGLNINYLDEDVATLISSYKSVGFIEMQLRNQNKMIKYDKEKSSVQLFFDIKEGFQIRVSDIVIKGNSFTKKDFIINNLPLKKGDIITAENIDLSIQTLSNLGVFSSINILTKEDNKDPTDRQLIIEVQERQPKSIRLGLGVNTERTLTARGGAEFSHRNIMGTGRSFFSFLQLQSNIARYILTAPSAEPEHLDHHASLIYVEPFLFSSGFNGQLDVSNTSKVFEHEVTKEKERVIESKTDIVNSTKINFLLKRTISRFIQLTWTPFSWESRREFDNTKNYQTNKDSSEEKKTLNIATTGVSLSVDKRNSIISTSEGFLSQIFLEYSGPFYIIKSSDNIQFVKMEFKHFDFQPVFKNWTWANSIQGGFITNINSTDTAGIPVSKSFILGGVNSLRGFDGLINGERVPDKDEFPIEDANELINTRSSFYLLLKTEMRLSITNNFTGSLFYDGGIVTVSGKEFKHPYRHSAGVGLRYKTPLGAVAGYVAIKISPKANELPVVPHLSFGSF